MVTRLVPVAVSGDNSWAGRGSLRRGVHRNDRPASPPSIVDLVQSGLAGTPRPFPAPQERKKPLYRFLLLLFFLLLLLLLGSPVAT